MPLLRTIAFEKETRTGGHAAGLLQVTHIDILPPSECRKPTSPPDRRFWQVGSFDTFPRRPGFLPFWQMGSFRRFRAEPPGLTRVSRRSDRAIMNPIMVAVTRLGFVRRILTLRGASPGFVHRVLILRGDLGGAGLGFVRRILMPRAFIGPGVAPDFQQCVEGPEERPGPGGLEHMPCLSALNRERVFPGGDFGPQPLRAFRRFASIRCGVVMVGRPFAKTG